MNDAPDRPSEPGFDLGPSAPAGSYRVLARKYRPATFDDLIGQEAMVRTVSNAFESGRIPQAWILTGVRGVGKTTTARILARALNYALPDGSITGPSIKMPVLGLHCQPIMESRHLDVIEMDAASHNGVDDVRQINDAIRYAPVQSRYKVYILDEVHMLSGAAFNALLKTLEEPPPHAKFIFATTEIRKVPVTVLSRCQRFDLRRVDADVLVKHLAGIAGKESLDAEPAALALIARAAEGSVRDALSLFDQAIAHAAGPIRAEDVRQMLGLADRARVIDLFEALMRGDVASALKELRDQYDSGADPAIILTDLAEFTHFVTRVKIVPAVADDLSLSEAERTRGRGFAAKLSMRVLSRTWQMLLKGIAEAQAAARPVAAAEMVLVRIAYAADLPTPDDVIRSLDDTGAPAARSGNGGGAAATPAPSAQRFDAPRGDPRATQARLQAEWSPVSRPESAPTSDHGARTADRFAQSAQARLPSAKPDSASAERALAPAAAIDPIERAPPPANDRGVAEPPLIAIGTFEELITLAAEKRDLPMKAALERDVRLVRCEDGKLEIALEPGAAKTLSGDLARKLSAWTGRRWMVVVSAETGSPTLRSQAEARRADLKRGVAADPLVQAVLARFPGAEIIDVRQADEPSALPPIDPDDPGPEPISDDSAFGAHGAPDEADDFRER